MVLRLLRGAAIEHVSAQAQAPAHLLAGWPRRPLDGGQWRRRSWWDPEARARMLAKAEIGDLVKRYAAHKGTGHSM